MMTLAVPGVPDENWVCEMYICRFAIVPPTESGMLFARFCTMDAVMVDVPSECPFASSVLAVSTSLPIGMFAFRVHVTTPFVPLQPGELGLTGKVVGVPLTGVPLTETTVSEIWAV